jgi:hypothetical protein
MWVHQPLKKMFTWLFMMCWWTKADAFVNTLKFFLVNIWSTSLFVFENIIGTFNICEEMDGTHIPLVDFKQDLVIIVVGVF